MENTSIQFLGEWLYVDLTHGYFNMGTAHESKHTTAGTKIAWSLRHQAENLALGG